MASARSTRCPPRVFLLSPARRDGKRARLLFEPATMFSVAAAIRAPDGAPIGEVFSFLSGLYFRGKLAYAEAFASPPLRLKTGAFVITTNRGLVSAATRVTLDDLARLAEVDIGGAPEPFRAPLQRDAETLAKALGQCGEAVLLSSSGVPGFNPRCRRAPLPRGCARAR